MLRTLTPSTTAIVALFALAACGDRTTGTSTPDGGSDQGTLRPERDTGSRPDPGGDAAGVGDASADSDVFEGECQVDGDCSDGVFCNGVERCFEGTCYSSPTPQCSDPSDCTDDICDEPNQRCDFVPNDTLCATGQVCTSKAGCFTPADCAVDSDCDDGLVCNGTETCVAGECQPGTPIECDDGIDCTVDSCDEGIGDCQEVADHGRCLPTELCGLIAGCTVRPPCMRNDDCDDGLFCNGRETCTDGVCTPGAPPTVPDSVDCTIDQCSETLDMVRHQPDNARCSDGQFCNGAEVCHPTNGCGPGAPPVLSDGVGCTTDTCDETLDFIQHDPDDTACDDGAFCNGQEVCHPVDDCQPGEPPVVNDGIGCTTDSCSEVMDEVLHVPNDGACDDGLFCNGAEVCDPVMDCQAGTAPVVDDGFDCTADSCDEAGDVVRHIPNDAACDDGMFCTGVETCDLAVGCTSTPPDLDDGVDCTMDMCDETNDTPVHVADDSFCDDGLTCTGTESCDLALGCRSSGSMVDDGIDCTIDSCDEQNGAMHVPDDSLCNNMLYCDGVETCDANSGCVDGPDPDVSDSDPCTIDSCDEATDSDVHSAAPDGTFCGANPSRKICLSGTCQTSTCGDGFVDAGAGEECESGADCVDCKIVAACDPDGAWTLSATIAGNCGFGLANWQMSSATFFNDVTTVSGLLTGFISPTTPVNMSSTTAATCPSGSFSVTYFEPGGSGGCDETYTLSGTFTDANNWSGTFTASFFDVDGTGACLDCDLMPYVYSASGFR